jgi:RNA polymerase sigma factor (sigma-70 family)
MVKVIVFMWGETRVEREGSGVMREPSAADCVPMGDALTARMPGRTFGSKRLLALAGDDRLVEQIRRGSEAAFEVAFERHGGGILGFCRHMLGSAEEAEDAVQHTFAAAFSDLQRGGEREITLKAWLYTIARNRCVSVLRARREQPAELPELPTDGLHEQVERRADLRALLGDLRELPEEQRAALLLAEAADLTHAEVAGVLGCEVARVKALVFRARSGLIDRREARETSCEDIREQLASLRGGSLRRSELRHHLRHCPGCAQYREQVRRQRQMLAVALPVVPSLGLKSSVLSAAGVSGGAAGGATAAGGGALGAGAASAGGGGLALGGSLGSAAVAKVALVAVLAGGGVVAGEAAVERATGPDPAAPAAVQRSGDGTQAGTPGRGDAGVRGTRTSPERSHGRRGIERSSARSRGHANAGARANGTPDKARGARGGRKLGQLERVQKQKPAQAHGRANSNAAPRGQAKPPGSKAPAGRGAPAKPAPRVKAQTQPAPAVSEPVAAPKATPAPVAKASPPDKVKLSK